MRLFVTQSEYEDRLAAAIESENHCTSQSRLLIDQISIQQGTIVSLQGAAAHLSLSLSTIIELDWSYLLFIYFMEIISEQNKRQSEECRQLKALLEDLESMFFYYLLELLRKLSSFTLSVSLFSLLLMVPANFYFILVHRNLVLGCKMRTQTTLWILFLWKRGSEKFEICASSLLCVGIKEPNCFAELKVNFDDVLPFVLLSLTSALITVSYCLSRFSFGQFTFAVNG